MSTPRRDATGSRIPQPVSVGTLAGLGERRVIAMWVLGAAAVLWAFVAIFAGVIR